MSFHAVVWLDHQEAKVFQLDPDKLTAEHFKANSHDHHVKHHGHGEHGDGTKGNDEGFFKHIAEALKPAKEVLVVGPGTGKLGFVKWVTKHDHLLADRFVSVETVDHPSDAQLVAYAKKYFRIKEKAA